MSSNQEQRIQRPPNVVLIVADDLGYGDLGAYGSSCNRTPHIDRLADGGTVLTDFYMSSPVCSPSRAALMTGSYPQRVGLGRGEHHPVLFPGDAIGLDPAEHTIPRAFKDAGYRTGMVGKWHLGDQRPFLPSRHGFDEYFGLPYSNDMHPPDPRPEFRFPRLPLIAGDEVVETDPDQSGLTDRYVAWADDFIGRHSAEPFFLYFAHMYVHTPIHAPPEYVERSKNGIYGAAVEHLDATVGLLVKRLQAEGVLDDTILVVTSDNGSTAEMGASNAPLRGRKFETWEGGVRVPCVINWSGRTQGDSIGGIVTAMDLLPTISSLCGLAEPSSEIDGDDLTGTLFGSGTSSPREVFYYYHADELQAVRWRDWKLRLSSGQLFNLAADVGEKTDVSTENPHVVSRIEELVDEARRTLGDQATGAVGSACRAPGRVSDPQTLTDFVDDDLIEAMYD